MSFQAAWALLFPWAFGVQELLGFGRNPKPYTLNTEPETLNPEGLLLI